MKKLLTALLLFVSMNLFAQVDFAVGMGISFVNNPSVEDYINGQPLGDELGTFNSAFEWYVEGDYTISPKFQIGLEYVNELFSVNSSYGGIGNFDFTYATHKPSLLAYYVLAGEGYKFKLGGGAGPRFADLDQKIVATSNYTTSGFGLLARIQAHTKLSDNFYANVGSTVRYENLGEPENSQGTIYDVSVQDNVNLNAVSVSVNIGVSYFLGN